MIFVLTFNLVAASSLRAHEIMELARKRLSAVGMGLSVTIFIGLLVFPMWASDEFHLLTSSKFNGLASCIEGDNFDPFTNQWVHSGLSLTS